MIGDLTPAEALETGEAFADVHRWAALAWRHVASASPARKDVLANLEDMTDRLEGLRVLLAGNEITDSPEGN